MGEQKQPLMTGQGLSLGQRLRHERERQHWSQEQLASALGEQGVIVSVSSINRWEHDKMVPRNYYRDLLCRVFHLSYEVLFGPPEGPAIEQVEQPHEQTLWTVPYLRNHFFTGRDDTLNRLHTTLTQQKTVALTALSGLGGIGKTQTALEYSYRYSEEYDTVLWLHAESLQALLLDYLLLAELLQLPEQQEADQMRIVREVMRWLQQTTQRWLLILDNVEHLEQVEAFLPTRGNGHTLLTTRSQALGAAMESIELDTLSHEEGALFLLRRAKLLKPEAPLEQTSENQRQEAEDICSMLGGLPLALDQAGAYIEENQCRLMDYRQLYETRRGDLLRRPGRGGARTTSQVVATTWTLSFEQVEQLNPAAADLLRLCAFLHPDGISEALLLAGEGDLGPVLQPVAEDPLLWDEAIGVLRRYSLVRRTAETKQLTLHRLVQVVLKGAMTSEVYKEWAERAVRVVSRAFPEVEYTSWQTCQAYLPHARLCADLIEQGRMRFPEAARLLNQTGRYLYERGAFAEAEPLYFQALTIREQVLGQEHLDTAQSLDGLGKVYWCRGKFQQAEPLLQRALTIYERQVGLTHPDTARSLNNLAVLYHLQSKYVRAEPLYRRALAIREQVQGPTHPETAKVLDNLAVLYQDQGKFQQSEEFYRRALAISEQVQGPTHPNTAISLNNLSGLYHSQGKYRQAELLVQRALAIREQALGPTHPETAESLHSLGQLSYEQGRYEQAELLFQRALAIREQALDPSHPHIIEILHDLAALYRERGAYEQAESLIQRALSICELNLGPEHRDTAICLSGLALIYQKQGKYQQAEPLFQRALAIRKQVSGADHPETTQILQRLAVLYHEQGQDEQAETLFRRALAIHVQALEGEHPDMGRCLAGLAVLYRDQGRYEQAEPLFQQALAVLKERLGAEHPTVAEVLEQYAWLLRQRQREAEARDLEVRADAIYLSYTQQGIQLPRVSRGEEALQQGKEDPLIAFLETCCELEPEGWVNANDLWQAYQQWCQETGEKPPLHRRAFAASLQVRGCQPAHTRSSRIWQGVRLRESSGQH